MVLGEATSDFAVLAADRLWTSMVEKPLVQVTCLSCGEVVLSQDQASACHVLGCGSVPDRVSCPPGSERLLDLFFSQSLRPVSNQGRGEAAAHSADPISWHPSRLWGLVKLVLSGCLVFPLTYSGRV